MIIMKRKLGFLICSLLVSLILTGCVNTNFPKGNANSLNNKTSNSKGNCTALECIKKISITDSVDDINKIIGFNGDLTDEKYNKYYWKLSDNEGIEVTYYSSSKGTIKVDINKDLLADKRGDFSRYNQLKNNINSGIDYNEFISYIGNVDGNLVEKSSITNKYLWVSSNGSYLNASFSNSSSNCTFISGMIK